MFNQTSSHPSAEHVFSIGHSTRSLGQLVEILKFYEVMQLIDVRTLPRSSRYPQFNKEQLDTELQRENIEYVHLPGLGGLRQARVDSINTGWENKSFRGYADYMQSNLFALALRDCLALIKEKPSVLMCAEAVPWRCHRSLIADALLVRGITVEHILDIKRKKIHELTSWAEINGMQVTYPRQRILPI